MDELTPDEWRAREARIVAASRTIGPTRPEERRPLNPSPAADAEPEWASERVSLARVPGPDYEIRAVEPAEQPDSSPSIEAAYSRLIELTKCYAVDLAKADGWKRLALALVAEHDPVLRFKPPAAKSAKRSLGSVGSQMASRMALHMALPEMPEHLIEPGYEREREAWDAARRTVLGEREKDPAAWFESRMATAFDRIVDEECRRKGITKTQTRYGNELETQDFVALKDRLRKQLKAFEKEYPEYFTSETERTRLPVPVMTPIEERALAYANHVSVMIAAADRVELLLELEQKN